MPARPGLRPAVRPPGSRSFPTAAAAVASLERKLGTPTRVWTYHDAAGEPVGNVVRWDGADGNKTFRPVAKAADGSWEVGAMPAPRPLYGLPELADAECVVVCEGEKAAYAARGIGLVATTSAGGANGAAKTDWSPLAGKDIWVLPDNDGPGREYARDVAALLGAVSPPARVRVVALPGLPPGGDIADWIDAHGDAAEPAGMRDEIEQFAAATAPEPCPPSGPPAAPRDALSFRPFPVDALPEPVRGFVAAGAAAIGCDPSYLALPLLVAIGAAVGNTRRLQLKNGWQVPPLLWAAVVGESGTAKTPAFQAALGPIDRRQQTAFAAYAEACRAYKADHAVWEREFAEWKRKGDGYPPDEPAEPAAERYRVTDTTIEALVPILQANPRGVLVARDELNGWLGSFDRYAGKSGADESNWLSLYNAIGLTVDRKSAVPRTIHVPTAAAAVVGGIQPGVLRRAVGDQQRESGLLARLLLAMPPRTAKRWTEAEISPAVERPVADLFDRLYELRSDTDTDGFARPAVVRLTPGAKTAWVAYYDAHQAEQNSLTGHLAAAWSKLEEHAARLALVVHFARWAAADPTLAAADALDAASLTAGLALVAWFKHEARRVYAFLDAEDAEAEDEKLVAWIAGRGGRTTAREVQQGCRWLKAPGAAEAAIESLVGKGKGVWADAPTTAQGGRPTQVFRLREADDQAPGLAADSHVGDEDDGTAAP